MVSETLRKKMDPRRTGRRPVVGARPSFGVLGGVPSQPVRQGNPPCPVSDTYADGLPSGAFRMSTTEGITITEAPADAAWGIDTSCCHDASTKAAREETLL